MKSAAILTILLLASCACKSNLNKDSMKTDDGIDIEINYYKDVCYGEGSQLCFLIKEKNDEAWTPIFENIQGFEYEWGYTYKLKVLKDKLDGPSRDGRTHSYKLIKEVEKDFVGEDKAFSLELDNSLITEENENYQLFNQVQISFASPSLQEKLSAALSDNQTVQCTFKVSKGNIILLSDVAY